MITFLDLKCQGRGYLWGSHQLREEGEEGKEGEIVGEGDWEGASDQYSE